MMTKIQPNNNTENFTNRVSETVFLNPRDKKPGNLNQKPVFLKKPGFLFGGKDLRYTNFKNYCYDFEVNLGASIAPLQYLVIYL
jgi:hypothetical protein